MAIDYTNKSIFAFPKGASYLDKQDRKAAEDAADAKAKEQVRKRDKGICRVCGRPATEVHEALKFKSQGGVASLQNSIHVCAQPAGHCHQLLQKHQIHVIGDHCSKPLIFEMRKRVADRIFGRRPVPRHVRVIG